MRRRRLAALAAAALVATSAPIVATAASAHEVVCSRGLRFAYVANSGDATVSVVDTTSVPYLVDHDGTGGEPPEEHCPWETKTVDLVTAEADGALDGEKLTVDDADEAVDAGEVAVSPGVAPFGVVASPHGDRIYVTHGAGNLVSVIETKDNTVAATFPVGDSDTVVLTGAAVSPDGARLYVVATADAAGTGPGRLYRIDTTGGAYTVRPPVAVGDAPSGVAIASTPHGERVFVTNTGDGTVSVLRPTNNGLETVTTIPVSDAPVAAAVNPMKNEAYVVNSGGEKSDSACSDHGNSVQDCAGTTSSISVIDTSIDPPSVRDIWVPPLEMVTTHPNGVAFAILDVFNNSSANPRRVRKTFLGKAAFTGVTVSPGGERVYVTAAEDPDPGCLYPFRNCSTVSGGDPTRGLVFRLDPSDASNPEFFSDAQRVDDAPAGVAVSPDGAWVYVTGAAEAKPSPDIARGTLTVLDGPKVNTFASGGAAAVGTAPTGVAAVVFDPESLRIVTHPASRTVTEFRDNVVFSVEVAGTAPFHYQWRQWSNGVVTDVGGNEPTYTFDNVSFDDPLTEEDENDDGKAFDVVVTQTTTGKRVTSKKAVLSVKAVPEIVPGGEFRPVETTDPDPDAPGFHRLGTLGAGRAVPRPMVVDHVSGIGLTNGSSLSCGGAAVYVFDLGQRRSVGAPCNSMNDKGVASQSLRGASGRIFWAGGRSGVPLNSTCSGDNANLLAGSLEDSPGSRPVKGIAYAVEGEGQGRSVSVGLSDSLFSTPCPRVGGAWVDYDAVTLASHAGESGDELVTLEVNSAGAGARDATVLNPGSLTYHVIGRPLTDLSRRAHESVLVRSFALPRDEDPLEVDDATGDVSANDEIPLDARWEVDLGALCASWLGDWVARTENALLTYCWDERAPGNRIELPGLSSTAPQGYLVKIPLDEDGYPVPREGTDVHDVDTGVEAIDEQLGEARDAADNDTGRIDERGLVYEPGSGGPTPTTTTTTTTTMPTTTTTTPGPTTTTTTTTTPGPTVEVDPDRRVLNATIRRIPTLSGPVTPIADPVSGRVFLLTADAANGGAVWVMDPDEERFVGVATSGLPWSEVEAYQKGRQYTHKPEYPGQNSRKDGHRTAVGFNPALGRAYVLGPTGILVVDGRGANVEGLIYPALGTYGAGEPELLPGSFTEPDKADQLAAYSVGGRHYVAIPVGGQGLVLFEDKVPVATPGDLLDPDRLTVQRDEREGETVATLSGIGEAAGAHVVVAGGATRGINTVSPGCRGLQESPENDTLVGPTANPFIRLVSFEQKMFDGECLADVLLSRGHREAYLGSSIVESASAGVAAHAQGMRVPSSDTATDADLREGGRCGASRAERGAASAFDYATHGLLYMTGDGESAGFLQRALEGSTNPLSGLLLGLAAEQWDWIPPDPEERFSNKEPEPLFDGFFGGYGQLCDPVREEMLDPAGLDTSEGTAGEQGEGFPARADCTDYGTGRSSKESGGERFADFSSAVTCDGAVPEGRAESSTSGFVLPSAEDPMVVVQSASSSIESRRVVENGKAYQVTEATAVAQGVQVGPVSMGALRTTSLVRAGGRTGTAQATLTREWCDVTVGAEVLAQGCSVVTGPEDPLVAKVADELSQVAPKLRISVPRANGPSGLGEATPGGAQSVVIKDEGLRVTDDAVNDDDSIVVPALQVTFLNDGPEGRNRWVVQLAGVEAEARYGINVLPSFTGSSFSSSSSSSKATPSTRRVLPGRKSLPRASTLIEGEAFDDFGSDLPAPGDPVQRFVTWVPNAIKDLLRLLIQHPLEFALLFLVFSLLATPPYLAYRRRQFVGVVAR